LIDVPIPGVSDDEEEADAGESKAMAEHKKKLKEFLQMQITQEGISVATRKYVRDMYVWGDQELDYAVFKKKNRKERGRKKTAEEEENELIDVYEKEDLEKEREYEYQRRKRGSGDMAQLHPNKILKQTTLRSTVFQCELESSLLRNIPTPLQKPLNPIFNTTYTICDSIYRLDYERIIVEEFEYILDLVRLDIPKEQKIRYVCLILFDIV
jgi:hypothetical protein